MWVYSLKTEKFLAVNAAAVALYGYSKAEFLSMTLADIGADGQVTEDRTAITDGRPLDVVGPHSNQTKSGERIKVLITSRPIEFAGLPARFVMAEDLSERERTQQQHDRARRLESIGELAGGVAHDFNNILGIIAPYAEFVAEAIVPEAVLRRASDTAHWERVGVDMATIQGAVRRGADLAHQLLAFAGREVGQPRPTDVKTVIDEVTTLLWRSLGEHIELVANVAPGTEPILIDPGQLEQILLNLAVNARHALRDGGTLTIDAENVPGPSTGSRDVRIRVSDTGTGMTAETRSRAFEPFFTTKLPGEGSGLGLASAYGIVHGAGGTIEISSEPNRGTTVTILLPASEAPVDVKFGESLDMTATIGEGEMLLLVEDDDVLRGAIERILANNGYDVLVAPNGNEALDLVSLHADDEIALLLTDVVMPKMLGRELASRVRAKQPGIRVIFMSGYAASALEPSSTLEEGSMFLKKPFGQRELIDKVREVLGQDNAFTRDPRRAHASALFEQRKSMRERVTDRERLSDAQREPDPE
jgi:PAS domain S-box-containing protein